jgi:hypothetical protein
VTYKRQTYDEFAAKKRAREHGTKTNPAAPARSNVLDLDPEERPSVDAAYEAVQTLKKTFEVWIVILRGLETLKAKADRMGGKKTFQRLREQHGLRNAVVTDAQVSNLFRISERLPEVEEWRRDELDDKRRYRWSAPNTIIKHCPIFQRPSSSKPRPKPAIRKEDNAVLEARIKELEAELVFARERIRELETELAGVRPGSKPAKVKAGKATPAKSALVWKEGTSVNMDGHDRPCFAAKAGRGEYSITPSYGLSLFRSGSATGFAGYSVSYRDDHGKPTSEKTNWRSLKSGRTPEAAKAIAQRDYERPARARRRSTPG